MREGEREGYKPYLPPAAMSPSLPEAPSFPYMPEATRMKPCPASGAALQSLWCVKYVVATQAGRKKVRRREQYGTCGRLD